MIIPIEMLDKVTLRAVIEEFVTRDGTDLTDVADNIARVLNMLHAGEAQLHFDPETESCQIVVKEESNRRNASHHA